MKHIPPTAQKLKSDTEMLADLSYLGLISVTGPDAQKFLQGQLTCNVIEITEKQSRPGAHCDPKGRIQCTFRLFKTENEYVLLLPRNIIPHALASLKKYALFFKVALNDISIDWEYLGISGPQAEKNLRNIGAEIPKNPDEMAIHYGIIVIKVPRNYPRFEILVPKKAPLDFKQKLTAHTIPVTSETWKLVNILAGIPTIYPETIGQFTPHHINYPAINGVCFTKGCYTGQEIIARMQYLGKLKQHMYGVTFTANSPPRPGHKIYNAAQQEIGMLVDAAADFNTGYIKPQPQAAEVLPDRFRDARETCADDIRGEFHKRPGFNYQGLAVLPDNALNNALHLENSENNLTVRTEQESSP